MNLLALDPGGTTGVAAIAWGGDPTPPPSSLLATAQIPFESLPEFLDDFLSNLAIHLIIVERFFISPRTVSYTRQPEALYAIGGAIFLGRLRGIPVRMQAASDAKGAFPNDRLAELGWKVRGRHAKDALRHVLLACLDRSCYTSV